MDPKQPQKPQQRDNRPPQRRPQQTRTGRYSGVHPSASGRPQHAAGARPSHTGSTQAHTSHRSGSAQKKAPTKTYQYSEFKARRSKFAPSREPANPDKKVTKKGPTIPPVAAGVVRIIPLGGVEEIGRNMTAIEIGNDIIVIDAGLQMKTVDTPGIDYIIPNTTYLEENKDRIRGLIVTHGHLDHTGGIPYIMDRIGNPTIYSRYLTTIMIQKRQEEFPHMPKLKIEVIENDSRITLGETKIRFFGVTHTIPDAMGVIVETPYGWVVDPGDFKLDHTDMVVAEKEEKEFSIFKDQKVLMLLGESTNVENPGFSTPEHLAQKGLEEIIKRSTGRLFIGTFASQMERMMKIIDIAEGLGKKIVIDGRSMKNNIEILKIVNRLKAKKETFIGIEDMANYPDSKIVALVTGAQGDEFGSLMRLSNKSHRQIKLHEGDTIVLSSSIIPGNEKAVEKLKDNLARMGAKIISYRTSDVYVHSTGHGNYGELEWMHKQIKPKFFMPIHGNHYRLQLHRDLALTLGMSKESIVVADNGDIIEITDNGEKIGKRKEKVPSSPYMVDGFSVGDEQNVVIRDRQMLAQDGMFVVIATVDTETGTLKKSPDLISRGFIYLKENQELLRSARHIIKKTVEDGMRGQKPVNFDIIKAELGDAISKFLFQKTAKRPLVIPVVLSV